jgi:putative ABC transport system substrate-binding protein
VRRRQFITLVGGAAVAWPLAARAQQAKMLRLGFAGMQPREAPHYKSFLGRMAELGYQEGRNFTFDYIQTPNVDGYDKSYQELAARSPQAGHSCAIARPSRKHCSTAAFRRSQHSGRTWRPAR